MRAALYEELNRQELVCILCSEKELKQKLEFLSRSINLKKDTLVIQACKTTYAIYYTKKFEEAETKSINVNLALKFRMEVDLFDLRKEMLRVEQAALQYPFDVLTDPYCLVRYMDLSDDFLILDVYVGVKERKQIAF